MQTHGLLLFLFTWATLSCGDRDSGANPPDASTVAEGAPDADIAVAPSLSYDLPGVGKGPADLSCLGLRSTPIAGDDTDITMPVRPFGAPPEVAIPGATVHFFPGNTVPDNSDCLAPGCLNTVADANGSVDAQLPSLAWFAYRVMKIANDDPTKSFWQTVEYNLTPERVLAANETANTITEAAVTGLALQSGVSLDRMDGVVSGPVRSGPVLDCQGRPMIGASIRAFTADGTELGTGSATRFRYFTTDTPPSIDSTLHLTTASGRYAVVNVGTGLTRIEVWGRADGDAVPKLIACEQVGVFSETLTILPILPLASDAPVACGTAN